jgi:hypothetical protein
MSCVKQTTKKYTGRKSPPYKANECCGKTKKGNDGLMYVSVVNVKGVCRWVKKTSIKKKSPKKKVVRRKTQPKKRRRKPAFFEAVTIEDHYNNIYLKESDITKYIKDTNKITGDILFVGTDYESRPEYGIVVVDLKSKNKFFAAGNIFYYSFSNELNKDEIIELCLKDNPKYTVNALKGLFKWYTSNETPFRNEVRKAFGIKKDS